MPWNECTVMSQRREVVEWARQGTISISELSRRFGVSRKTIYKWLARHQAQGVAGLQDQSRRPQSSSVRTPPPTEEQVVQLRQQHPAWGGRKLRRRLQTLGLASAPAASTITEILRRRGLLGQSGQRPSQPYQRFEHEHPNDLWQMDFKGHVAMRGDRRCHPLTVLDDHSRYALALEACGNEQGATVQQVLIKTFRRYGLPQRMLTDNGSPWGVSHGSAWGVAQGSSWTKLTIWLHRLGVRMWHGRPCHPQTQGKDERFHRTLLLEVLGPGGAAESLAAYQRRFDPWRVIYNHERPHEALGLDVPASRYRVSARAYPEVLPEWEYPSGDTVRKVQLAGQLKFRGVVWEVGKPFEGEFLAVRATTTEGVWNLWLGGALLGELNERTARGTGRRRGRVAAPVGLRPPCAATLPTTEECT